MDPNVPQDNNQAASNQQRPGQPQGTHLPGSSGGMKIIQPLSSDLKVEPVAPKAPAQPALVPAPVMQPGPLTTDASLNTTNSQPVVPSPSPLYPTATRGMNAAPPNFAHLGPNLIQDTPKSMTFEEGYALGGSIFWYQLLVGVIVSIVGYLLLKVANTAVAQTILYIIEYLVILYVPYEILKSKAIEEPFWTAIIGAAVQSMVNAMLVIVFVLVDDLVLKAAFSGKVASIGTTSVSVVTLGMYIAAIIASYFLTKLSWGITFSLIGKIKSKVLVKAIGISLIAIFVAVIAYHFLLQASSNTFRKYTVTGNPSFSVNFYGGSSVTMLGGQTVLLHRYTTGSSHSGYIYVTDDGPATTHAVTSCPQPSLEKSFTFSVQGDKGLGCYQASISTGFVQVNGQAYEIHFDSYAQQTSTLANTESILNSVTIN